MAGREMTSGDARPMSYCLIPRELAAKLHEPLRRHFSDNPSVEVIVESRSRDRRSLADRRREQADAPGPRSSERRKIRSRTGLRVAERRAALIAGEMAELPRRARPFRDEIVFAERIEPSGQALEDADTARLVMRIQGGENELFGLLYMRYFDRVYGYLRVLFGHRDRAEEMSQQVFTELLGTLASYERREQPFRAWLFAVVRNRALSELRRDGRLELAEPAAIDRLRERSQPFQDEPMALGWITDRDLVMFVERLPLTQRQVLLLRYMLDFTIAETAAILGRTPGDVSAYQRRALETLRERLSAIGRGDPARRSRAPVTRWVTPARVLRRRRFALLSQ